MYWLLVSSGYLVEKKPKGSDDWQKVNDIPCIGNSMLVPDLVENSDMEFRVMAVNAAGPSEPSGCSSPIKIKEKIGTYYLAPQNQVYPFPKRNAFYCLYKQSRPRLVSSCRRFLIRVYSVWYFDQLQLFVDQINTSDLR